MLHATSPQSMNVAVSGSTSAIRSTHQNLELEVRNRVLLRAGLELVTIVLQGMRTDLPSRPRAGVPAVHLATIIRLMKVSGSRNAMGIHTSDCENSMQCKSFFALLAGFFLTTAVHALDCTEQQDYRANKGAGILV
jgi:hypothetical protein